MKSCLEDENKVGRIRNKSRGLCVTDPSVGCMYMVFGLLNNGSIFNGNRMDLIYSYDFPGTQTMNLPPTDLKTKEN